MNANNMTIRGKSALELYQRDCLFDGKCALAIVEKEYDTGVRHLVTQCTTCGQSIGEFIARKLIPATTEIKPFDEELCHRVYQKKLEASWGPSEEQKLVHQKESYIQKQMKLAYYRHHLGIESIEFGDIYVPYIHSKLWEAKRQAILERDNYTCRFCEQNKAVQVHHLSYANLGNESDFELMSVCLPCNQRIHQGREESMVDLITQPQLQEETHFQSITPAASAAPREAHPVGTQTIKPRFELPSYRKVSNNTEPFLNVVEMSLKTYHKDLETYFTWISSRLTLVVRNICGEATEVLIDMEKIKFQVYGLPFEQFLTLRSSVHGKLASELKPQGSELATHRYWWHHNGLVLKVFSDSETVRMHYSVHLITEVAAILQ